jgi:hypothetical protein
MKTKSWHGESSLSVLENDMKKMIEDGEMIEVISFCFSTFTRPILTYREGKVYEQTYAPYHFGVLIYK